MIVVCLILLQASGAVGSPACRDEELSAMLRAQEHLARGDDAMAAAVLTGDARTCAIRRVAMLAVRGWTEARALAPGGGAIDLQGPVRDTLSELTRFSHDEGVALEVEYAQTSIRAAIAAAQDERAEMELLLTHARDLAERLQLRGRVAIWPRSFNLLAGELWFEVDRYEDAIVAYERAVRADASAMALVGLARALVRAGRLDDACVAYARVTGAAPPLRAVAMPDLVRCR